MYRKEFMGMAVNEARKVPGLGDAIDVAEKASYASHLVNLFKKKK